MANGLRGTHSQHVGTYSTLERASAASVSVRDGETGIGNGFEGFWVRGWVVKTTTAWAAGERFAVSFGGINPAKRLY